MRKKCPHCPQCGEVCVHGHLSRLPHRATENSIHTEGMARPPHRHTITSEVYGRPVVHVWFDD